MSASINAKISEVTNFIWQVADKFLYSRGFQKTDYRDVILPMTLIARLDSALKCACFNQGTCKNCKTEQTISNYKDQQLNNDEIHRRLLDKQTTFYNLSGLVLKDIAKEKNETIKDTFKTYLEGFSLNVQNILDNFDGTKRKWKGSIETLDKNNNLGGVISFFINDIDLSIQNLDNHCMGTIFEELLRRFNEEENAESGQHYTLRDAIELMAQIAINPLLDNFENRKYSIYDGACGTLGMATIGANKLLEIAQAKNITDLAGYLELYGQEVESSTCAIAQTDLLLSDFKGKIEHANTLIDDKFPHSTFDFMLSNPPFGVSFAEDAKHYNFETDFRFKKILDEEEVSLLPSKSDSQFLFLLNNISKMFDNNNTSRIVEVHNGSVLFSGDALSGESNTRRYLIEQDFLETIIALPKNMFYNTGINTYLWILTNHKEDKRKHKIQLIDAREIYSKRNKNLGTKNAEFSHANQQEILKLYNDFLEQENSKIFDNTDFGYLKVTINRPLRLSVHLNNQTFTQFKDALNNKPLKALNELTPLTKILETFLTDTPYKDFNAFKLEFNKLAKAHKLKQNVKTLEKHKDLSAILFKIDENAQIVLDDKNNKIADPNLKESEKIPLNYDKSLNIPTPLNLKDKEHIRILETLIKSYLNAEILPYNSDAYYDSTLKDSLKLGYEINFNKIFYTQENTESLETLALQLKDLEQEIALQLKEILEGAS
ncbi:class I SAM-dependent DNA methyltransferase [Helicobacter cetorum]|uniref:site-specific DNA-methyltransferase (adenine-specific) n=1 Tax=Helicobacter cetorum (strain ATCC BAA-540 / CCUG 52418 / MIT 99-5656) TaxID=1163745 RepID=I0ESP3_HELCM|nr:N-6 DNA methylase [Helicobacter cetorum]AFI05962.1 N-6 DNA methylase [Helicobacter cetorum MIT 99-5656]